MSIINKYLTKEIIKLFGLILIMVVGIYIVVDFLEKIDDFMEAGLSFSKAFTFFVYKTPFIIAQIAPVGILLSVLIVFGLMNRNNEVIALTSSGVSTFYLLKPVIILGFLFTALLFLLSEVLVPITTVKANRIWLGEVRKELVITSKAENIWIKGDRIISHIRFFNPMEKAIFGITVHKFDKEFRLIERIDAEKGFFRDGQWQFYEALVQQLNPEQGDYESALHNKMTAKFDFLPDDLKRVVKKSEEMSFSELADYMRKVEKEGYDATNYRVDLYAKIAFPFVCIIMSMVGISIGIRRQIRDALPIGVSIGIGTAFLYWIFYSFCVSLGYSGMIPPMISVWTANLIFFCLAILNLLYAD